ncbi:hypothetical protein Q9L42_003350 [Methylomarinum sp. Ch1-1]|uniref:Uncharacterized protein n=1 Tax=Methylomarinum roseum TaxID=3067653 RepID=A0AAU7NX87_9GAMM|nr:hypothetical protein [Methylomarinum sp. Ch1-1]MDP4522774.1 hypothetical protein [Methylomarinum sp. Ch1-1]
MSFATFGKILLLLIWPLLFLVILYFNDKEKFKQRLKQFKWKDW